MPIVINATEENVTIQAHGSYFTWKPGQRKKISKDSLAHFIQIERKGYGLAVVPDITSQEEDDGDVELSDEARALRVSAAAVAEKAAIDQALKDYIDRQRDIIKNNQVSLARDLARKDYKYSADHEMTEGEFRAMELVAKYDKKGKDAAQERLDRIEKLKKQIDTK